jgi:hypothetical protein
MSPLAAAFFSYLIQCAEVLSSAKLDLTKWAIWWLQSIATPQLLPGHQHKLAQKSKTEANMEKVGYENEDVSQQLRSSLQSGEYTSIT